MHNYHRLLSDIMEQGEDQFNERTGEWCRVIVGTQLTYDLSAGFPAITTKKLAFKGVVGELLGFFRGYTSAADFRALGCNVWNDDANKNAGWLKNPNRGGEDHLGRIYGAQWTGWRAYRLATKDYAPKMEAEGWRKVLSNDLGSTMVKEINQLENSLKLLLTDPSNRRNIVSGWNVGELDMMALPPCHMDYRFVALNEKLHVVMTIRSWDCFLGAPFNIASTSLFLAIMARLSGFTPGTVTIQATNAHIYHNHFNQVLEQLTRTHFEAPQLVLSDDIKRVKFVEDIPGVFTRIEPEHIQLSGYESHEAIKAPMAVGVK